MFKLQAEPTFWASAPISVPGQKTPVPLEIEFRWYGREKLRTYLGSLSDRDDVDLLGEIIVGWKGVDEAYSPDALAKLLDLYPRSADAIFETFKDELLKAKEKN